MIARETYRGRAILLLVGVSLLGQCAWLAAQPAGDLPATPDYRGAIRRGADGKLIALPESSTNETVSATASPGARTLVVGAGERISSIAEAARQARDGDIIEIRPGDYRGQPAVWTQRDITIRGVGKRPVMVADGTSAEGKAIWVVRGSKVLIENIEFRGARVASGNGAGIRFEQGSLTVRRCRFVDNEMGILTANTADMSLEVVDSDFADAPRHAGDLHHLLYVGAIGKFVLRGSRFQNGYQGHLVKSRARENHILYNMLVDGSAGQASYELEFPNGGIAFVIGNAIGQAVGTNNPSIVSYGAEGRRWPENALFMAHNTLINDAYAGSFMTIRTDKLAENVEVWLLNNLIVGMGDFFKPAQGRFDGNRSVAKADLIEFGGLPLRLNSFSTLRGTVQPPGQARGVILLPDAEFAFPVGTRRIQPSSRLAPGAFQ